MFCAEKRSSEFSQTILFASDISRSGIKNKETRYESTIISQKPLNFRSEKQAMKSVVITGASTGIGKSAAILLSEMGWQVFAGVRKESDANELVRISGGKIQPIQLEVTDAESIKAAAALIESKCKELNGLVNNAGIVVAAPLEFVPMEDLRKQFEVNVIGQIAVTQAFLPMLRKSKGRVINVGSVSGIFATPFTGPYCASKFAMEAMSDALRMELKPWDIEVSLIQPGSIATPIWEKSMSAAESLEKRMPARAFELYRKAIDAVKITSQKTAAKGIPAEAVADVIYEALTVRKPKTRYLVGKDARTYQWLLRLFSDRFRDKLVLKQMRLWDLK